MEYHYYISRDKYFLKNKEFFLRWKLLRPVPVVGLKRSDCFINNLVAVMTEKWQEKGQSPGVCLIEVSILNSMVSVRSEITVKDIKRMNL